jgi:CBS-domain-containing membrane protein
VSLHPSTFGDGKLSMRQRNASPYLVVPAVPNPAARSAASADCGCPAAQPRSMLPLKDVKSTITVTPAVVVHDTLAPTCAVGAVIAMAAITAPSTAVCNERARMLTSFA